MPRLVLTAPDAGTADRADDAQDADGTDADDSDADNCSFCQFLSRHQIPCNGSVFLLDCYRTSLNCSSHP